MIEYVCMYTYRVHMYVCMWIESVYVEKNVCMHAHIYVHIYIHTYICVHV